MFTLMQELAEGLGQPANLAAESLPQPQGGAAPVVLQPNPQGFTTLQPIPGENVQSIANFMADVLRANCHNNNNISIISGLHNPILYNSGGAGPSTSTPPMDFSPAVTLWSKAHCHIFEKLSLDNSSLEPHKRDTLDQLMKKCGEIVYSKMPHYNTAEVFSWAC